GSPMEIASLNHCAAEHSRTHGCISAVVDGLHQRFRHSDDPWQGQGPLRLQPDLQPVQRSRQLPPRLGDFYRPTDPRDPVRDDHALAVVSFESRFHRSSMTRAIDDLLFFLLVSFMAALAIFLFFPLLIAISM